MALIVTDLIGVKILGLRFFFKQVFALASLIAYFCL
jgi:hypothetical protein